MEEDNVDIVGFSAVHLLDSIPDPSLLAILVVLLPDFGVFLGSETLAAHEEVWLRAGGFRQKAG